MAKKAKEQNETLSFRTGARYLAELERRGARDGISVHLIAKKVLEASLDEREDALALLQVELADLRAEFQAMKNGLQLVLVGLIHSITNATGEKLTLEEAQEFVTNAFTRTGRSAADAQYQ